MQRREDAWEKRDRPQQEMRERPDGPTAPGQYFCCMLVVHISDVHLLSYHIVFNLSSCVKQIDNPSSKSVPIVVTVVIIMLLSIAGGILFVKKYVCGGRSDRFPFPCLSMLDVSVTVTWRQSECALQVFGSQVLGATAACGGSHCWQHGRPAGDGPRSERQDWVSWRLRWGRHLLFPYTKAVIET